MKWFDAHLDLAYLAVLGRNMHAQPDASGGPDLPAGVTLPALREGGIAACLGTIFTEMGAAHGAGYARDDAEGAHRAGLRQLALYQQWDEAGVIRSSAWQGMHEVLPDGGPPRVGILMECADPIAGPDELAWWAEQGVVAIGLAWAKGSRYSGGNTNSHGLTPLGLALIPEMDRLGIVHDASHLSDRAFDELLDVTQRPVIASHSNCRALIDGTDRPAGSPPTQRHLTDGMIRGIAVRKGVIGLNLYSPFLIPGGTREGRATIGQAIDHVEHVCMVAGHMDAVGLGSDMDGGFSALRLPEGIDLPRDLVKLGEELRRRGWNDADIGAFAWGNWARFWQIP